MEPTNQKTLFIYETEDGKAPFTLWFDNIKDKKTESIILKRLGRVRLGNFGEYRTLKDGVFELKINHGPGFRVYFALEGETIVILLLGGDKSSQEQDINKAKEYYHDFKRRNPL